MRNWDKYGRLNTHTRAPMCISVSLLWQAPTKITVTAFCFFKDTNRQVQGEQEEGYQ